LEAIEEIQRRTDDKKRELISKEERQKVPEKSASNTSLKQRHERLKTLILTALFKCVLSTSSSRAVYTIRLTDLLLEEQVQKFISADEDGLALLKEFLYESMSLGIIKINENVKILY
jgi:beta-phosphoglucomutase-like phosphatase (HAD superfamily)